MNLKMQDCLGCKQKLSPSNFYGTKSNLNYLYKCPNSNCGICFWHQDVLKEFVYVGETGNHPLRRYLNHLRGHKKGKYGKRYPTYLLDFELSVQDSKQREKDLAKELKSLYEVKGGHWYDTN